MFTTRLRSLAESNVGELDWPAARRYYNKHYRGLAWSTQTQDLIDLMDQREKEKDINYYSPNEKWNLENYRRALDTIKSQEITASHERTLLTDGLVSAQIKTMKIYLFKAKREGQSATAVSSLASKSNSVNALNEFKFLANGIATLLSITGAVN